MFCFEPSLGLPQRGRWCSSGFLQKPITIPPAAGGGIFPGASCRRETLSGWVSLQPRDFYKPARPHPESLSKRNKTGSAGWGDFVGALAVCFRL